MTAPIDVEKMKWDEFRESDEIRFRVKSLSSGRGVHIGVEICELDPGCNTAPAHYHMKEEEHTLVLSGAMEVRLGKEWVRFSEGEYMRFPAQDKREHMFRNPFDMPCRYLMFGERFPDEVVIYPDDQAAHVRLLGGRLPYKPEEKSEAKQI